MSSYSISLFVINPPPSAVPTLFINIDISKC
jgi:hypothetical protein